MLRFLVHISLFASAFAESFWLIAGGYGERHCRACDPAECHRLCSDQGRYPQMAMRCGWADSLLRGFRQAGFNEIWRSNFDVSSGNQGFHSLVDCQTFLERTLMNSRRLPGEPCLLTKDCFDGTKCFERGDRRGQDRRCGPLPLRAVCAHVYIEQLGNGPNADCVGGFCGLDLLKDGGSYCQNDLWRDEPQCRVL